MSSKAFKYFTLFLTHVEIVLGGTLYFKEASLFSRSFSIPLIASTFDSVFTESFFVDVLKWSVENEWLKNYWFYANFDWSKNNFRKSTQTMFEHTSKTMMGWFLWTAPSEKFEIASKMLSRDQKNISGQWGVRDNETIYKAIDH